MVRCVRVLEIFCVGSMGVDGVGGGSLGRGLRLFLG